MKLLKWRTCRLAVMSIMEQNDVRHDFECTVEQCRMTNAASSDAEVMGARLDSSRNSRIRVRGSVALVFCCQLDGNEVMIVSV